jgi:hypothetical protein
MIRVLALLVILSLSSEIFAQQCTEFNKPGKARVYYVNGMLSDNVNNNNARTLLETTVGNKPDNVYRMSVNRTKNFAADGYQSFKQRSGEIDPKIFWQQWHGTNPGFPQTSPEFQESLADAIVAAATVQVNSDADLAAMVGQYLIDLNAGKKVILVSHSQGNFYANRAQEFIADNNPELAPSLGVISVASPSGSLAPGALLTQNSQDTVIFGTVAGKYSVLPANVNFFGINDKRHHGFLTTYMLTHNARARISGHVQTMINQLPEPIAADCDDRVAKINTLNAINVTSSKADLRGDLISGVNVDAWIVFDKNPSNVVCNGASQNGTGPFSASSVVSETVTGLTANTLYYVRACAKGQKGEVSDGGLKQFITKRNDGKMAKPYPINIESTSFKLQSEVLEGQNIDTWFVRGSAGQTQSPICSGSSYDGIGTASEGDQIVSDRFTGLVKDTEYRVRACAKGSNGVTNSSPSTIVKTTAIPTTTCGNQAFQGGTNGLSVVFNLGQGSGAVSGSARVIFQTFTVPDRLQIYKHGTNQLLLATNGFVSGQNIGSFSATGIDKVDVYVTANSTVSTRWELTIECPI